MTEYPFGWHCPTCHANVKKEVLGPFSEEVEFPCPFCGARCATIEPPGVLHAMPPCKQFIDLDPIAFLKAANWVERRKN